MHVWDYLGSDAAQTLRIYHGECASGFFFGGVAVPQTRVVFGGLPPANFWLGQVGARLGGQRAGPGGRQATHGPAKSGIGPARLGSRSVVGRKRVKVQAGEWGSKRSSEVSGGVKKCFGGSEKCFGGFLVTPRSVWVVTRSVLVAPRSVLVKTFNLSVTLVQSADLSATVCSR